MKKKMELLIKGEDRKNCFKIIWMNRKVMFLDFILFFLGDQIWKNKLNKFNKELHKKYQKNYKYKLFNLVD